MTDADKPRKRGRPKGQTVQQARAARAQREQAKAEKAALKLAKAEAKVSVASQTTQQRVAERQRKDLIDLQSLVNSAVKQGEFDPAGIGALARATKILHELEAVAYGFNEKSAQVKAIIVLPMPADSMASWTDIASKVLGTKEQPRSPALPVPGALDGTGLVAGGGE